MVMPSVFISSMLCATLFLTQWTLLSMAAMMDLNFMIQTIVGVNPGQLIGYGNYCGMGNFKGTQPVDDVDNCCRLHDDCYDISQKKCHGKHFSDVKYRWRIHRTGIFLVKTATCEEKKSATSCPYLACTCDKNFTDCLRKIQTRLNPKFYRRHFMPRMFITAFNRVYLTFAKVFHIRKPKEG